MELVLLNPSHADAFLEVVDDPEARQNFSAFNAEKDEIVSGLERLNDDPATKKYWGLFLEDGTLAGYIALQKSHGIWKLLKKLKDKEAGISDIDDLSELDETDAQRKRRVHCEEYQSPYAVDVVVHPKYRGKGIAQAAIAEVVAYALKAGIPDLYFEVHQENKASLKLIKSIKAEHITAIDNYFYPGYLYHLNLAAQPETREKVKSMINSLDTIEEKSAYNRWREFTAQVPELLPHKDIMHALFLAISEKGAHIKFVPDSDRCHWQDEVFDKMVYIGTKKRDAPLSLIWSIAHEYGHLCQPDPIDLEKKYCTREKYLREADAWDIAEVWLSDKPFFQHNWPDFIRFRNSRLESYLPREG